MKKTIDDLIAELQALKPELRKLPVVIESRNGFLFEPVAKIFLTDKENVLDEPKKMVITYE